jgi:hypothetical protein
VPKLEPELELTRPDYRLETIDEIYPVAKTEEEEDNNF